MKEEEMKEIKRRILAQVSAFGRPHVQADLERLFNEIRLMKDKRGGKK